MKQTFYPLCLALGLLATACSSDSPTLPDNQPENALKTPITFSSGVAGGSVGRVVTSGADNGFTAATEMVMHIRSVKKDSTPEEKKYTRTTATAEVQADNKSKVNFEANDYRYWDDAYGRAAQLSVFAVAVANKMFNATGDKLSATSLPAAGNNGWTETAPTNGHTLEWTVSDTQTETTIAQEDLVYSNNNRTGSEMTFKLDNDEVPNGPGKFDTGQLMFDHALTRITVKLKAGKGFEAKPFNFTNSKHVELVNMPTKGTLDVENGTWTLSEEAADKKNINTYKETTNDAGISHTLRAQIFPEYSLSSSETATNMMQFTIDDNTYYVTKAMALTALHNNTSSETISSDSYTLQQGKNYIFTITVKKAAISVTATVAKWADVEAANIDKNNAHLSFDFKTPDGGTACDHFDLYRLGVTSENIVTGDTFKDYNWKGNYVDDTTHKFTPSGSMTGTSWNTGWYYESNKEFYHLRTVDKNMEIKGNTNDTDDYFEITSGPVDDAFYSDPPTNTVKNPSYNDYHWGAPMQVSDPTYDVEKGYADHIYHAVGATNMPIRISEFHTMSDIHIVLKTTNGQDAVKLFDETKGEGSKHTKIRLMRYYPNGTVRMGDGLVSTTGTVIEAAGTEITTPPTDNAMRYYKTSTTVSNDYTYRVVPQPLDYTKTTTNDTHIGLEIQTPDDNVYYINQLSTIVESVNSTPIDRWYPGKKYTYTFTLRKTGINVTCTVANWQDITASDTNVDLTK